MVNRGVPVSIAMTSSQISPSSISSRASCVTATAYQSRPDLDRLVYVANRLGVASVVVDRWSYIRICKRCFGDLWCLRYFLLQEIRVFVKYIDTIDRTPLRRSSSRIFCYYFSVHQKPRGFIKTLLGPRVSDLIGLGGRV